MFLSYPSPFDLDKYERRVPVRKEWIGRENEIVRLPNSFIRAVLSEQLLPENPIVVQNGAWEMLIWLLFRPFISTPKLPTSFLFTGEKRRSLRVVPGLIKPYLFNVCRSVGAKLRGSRSLTVGCAIAINHVSKRMNDGQKWINHTLLRAFMITLLREYCREVSCLDYLRVVLNSSGTYIAAAIIRLRERALIKEGRDVLCYSRQNST